MDDDERLELAEAINARFAAIPHVHRLEFPVPNVTNQVSPAKVEIRNEVKTPNVNITNQVAPTPIRNEVMPADMAPLAAMFRETLLQLTSMMTQCMREQAEKIDALIAVVQEAAATRPDTVVKIPERNPVVFKILPSQPDGSRRIVQEA